MTERAISSLFAALAESGGGKILSQDLGSFESSFVRLSYFEVHFKDVNIPMVNENNSCLLSSKLRIAPSYVDDFF